MPKASSLRYPRRTLAIPVEAPPGATASMAAARSRSRQPIAGQGAPRPIVLYVFSLRWAARHRRASPRRRGCPCSENDASRDSAQWKCRPGRPSRVPASTESTTCPPELPFVLLPQVTYWSRPGTALMGFSRSAMAAEMGGLASPRPRAPRYRELARRCACRACDLHAFAVELKDDAAAFDRLHDPAVQLVTRSHLAGRTAGVHQ